LVSFKFMASVTTQAVVHNNDIDSDDEYIDSDAALIQAAEAAQISNASVGHTKSSIPRPIIGPSARMDTAIVATQAYPGWPLSRGRVAVLDCVPAPAGPVQNGVSGAAAVRFLRVGPALSVGAFPRL
jgi:hypothetical protein